jgi:hypothetical protein
MFNENISENQRKKIEEEVIKNPSAFLNSDLGKAYLADKSSISIEPKEKNKC